MFDDIIDFLGEGWDAFVDGLSYLFTGELFQDIPDFFGSMFENISEFSIIGLAFGILGVGVVYMAKDYMLMPFLKFYDPFGQVLWGSITYVGTFVAGYFLGKYFENS